MAFIREALEQEPVLGAERGGIQRKLPGHAFAFGAPGFAVRGCRAGDVEAGDLGDLRAERIVTGDLDRVPLGHGAATGAIVHVELTLRRESNPKPHRIEPDIETRDLLGNTPAYASATVGAGSCSDVQFLGVPITAVISLESVPDDPTHAARAGYTRIKIDPKKFTIDSGAIKSGFKFCGGSAMDGFLGLFIVGFAGFAPMAVVHNAAYDFRHSMGFPCH